MSADIDELRPVSAGRLLTIRRAVWDAETDELVRSARCNARVLAECCFWGGIPVFADEDAVLNALTFREMEMLLRQLAGAGTAAGSTAPSAVNPNFDAARFARLREG